jgi:hypothetical protein
MATKPLDDEQEPLELTEEVNQAEEPDTQESEELPDPDAEEPAADDEEETIISFDGEDDAGEEGETPTIKRLRERNREQTRLLREREKRIAELERSTAAPVEIGPKPTLETCDYDEERFESELDAWKERRAEASQHEARLGEQNRRANESWQQDVTAYVQRKTTLGVSDYEISETAVSAALSDVQQAVIVKAAKDPAALIYALGKSDAKLAELSKYDDPIKLAAAVARMEGAVKVMKRKKAPEIDQPQRGSASLQNLTSDERLERLEKEAERIAAPQRPPAETGESFSGFDPAPRRDGLQAQAEGLANGRERFLERREGCLR